MLKRIVSGTMLAFLLIGMLTLAFNIQPVKASGTIYIRADGSIDPPTAPISTVDNVTYTLTGNITSTADGIVVERSNIIIDGAGYTVQGPAPYVAYCKGISLSGRKNVTVMNIEIRAFDFGIYLSYSSDSNIHRSNIKANNLIGLVLQSSSNNGITTNNITNNYYGIQLSGSDNNCISGNQIVRNGPGTSIFLSSSSNNSIFGNNVRENLWGIALQYSSNNSIYHNNFIDNTIQAGTSDSENVWDDDYPAGGNYWSDYAGVDADGDGIGDTPYIIDTDNQDRYPLMHPWSSLPVHNINTGLGYATIQEAINANETLDGHTIFVEEGTYYEHVTINKSIELIGEDRSTTIIDGGSTAIVVNVTASGVTISNFTIQHGEGIWPSCGIFTYHSSNNIIDSNIVLNNTYGIYLYELCNSNIITGNNVSNNKDGIWLAISNDNIVEGNNVYSNDECGVVLGLSDNNTISYNDFSKNGIGIILTESSNNTVSDNDVYLNSGNGIQLSASDYNILIGNNAYSNNKGTGPPYSIGGGVVLGLSNNNTVDGNDVYSNGNHGIWLDQCADNWVSNNKVWDNYVGIYLTSSNNTNTVGYNDASDNYYGILLGDSGNSIVIGNHVSGNQAGICFLASSSDNTVTCNNVLNNYIGIYLQFELSKNLISHNNFINNTQHVGIYPSGYAYSWDDGYPSGGNYWSDYVGVDIKNGPGQGLPGSDSIGDTPYIIDVNNVDHYPLMNPYGAPPPPTYALTITATVGGTTDPSAGTYGYTANSLVQVTAIPSINYLFDHWELDSINVGLANPYTVLMDKNHMLKAVFSPVPPPKPVGGYSFQTDAYTPANPLTPYLALTAIVTMVFIAIKRKRARYCLERGKR